MINPQTNSKTTTSKFSQFLSGQKNRENSDSLILNWLLDFTIAPFSPFNAF